MAVFYLCHKFIGQWSEELWLVINNINLLCFSRLFRDTASYCKSTILTRLFLSDIVVLNTVKEVFPTFGMVHMFNTYINPLGKDFSLDTLIHDNSKSNFSHIVHTASLPM